jgi:hypothetical protein
MFGKEDIGVNWLFPEQQRCVVVVNEEDIDQADSWPVTRPFTSRCVSVTSAYNASRSGENQQPLETSSLYFERRPSLG